MVISHQVNQDLEKQLPILIAKLRQQLRDDKKLMKYRSDDEFLIKFLRVRDYDVNSALSGVRIFVNVSTHISCEVNVGTLRPEPLLTNHLDIGVIRQISIQKYYRNIERNRDIIDDIKPSQFISVFDENIILILKERNKFGSKVGISRPGLWDPTKFSIRDLQLASVFLAEEITNDKETQLNGVSVIFDMKDLSFQHIKQLSLTEIRRIITTAQEGLPVKVAAIHFINYPSIFWAVYFVIQKCLKQKIRERTHLHSTLESLHQHFDSETLPISLGGRLEIPEIVDKDILTILLENDKHYKEYYVQKRL